MQQDITTVGLDLAKSVFQVHAINADGEVLVRRQLRRAEVLRFFSSLPPCLVGMEACASAHHWGRELLALGHDVRLMPPAYVKPYVKRGKTDAADAEAICEAVTRPTMRFVAVKSVEQQAVLMLHKTRDLLVRQRTALINALRAHLSEYGIVTGKGPGGVTALMKHLHKGQEKLPTHARSALHTIGAQQPCGAARIGRTHECTRPVRIAAQNLLHHGGRPQHQVTRQITEADWLSVKTLLKIQWSPEQITAGAPISHETIYRLSDTE